MHFIDLWLAMLAIGLCPADALIVAVCWRTSQFIVIVVNCRCELSRDRAAISFRAKR
jgi:hypothetical protein